MVPDEKKTENQVTQGTFIVQSRKSRKKKMEGQEDVFDIRDKQVSVHHGPAKHTKEQVGQSTRNK